MKLRIVADGQVSLDAVWCAYRAAISSIVNESEIEGVVTSTYGYDAFGSRVLQTGTSTTYIYPFKWYSIASSTGTGAKYSTTTEYVWNGDTLVATVDKGLASGVATGSPAPITSTPIILAALT